MTSSTDFRYSAPGVRTDRAPYFLIARSRDGSETKFPFYEQIEIGRDDGRAAPAGTILVSNPAVSRRHCVISRHPDGRCWIRDTSRNGTRIDGRRLVPNVECELRSGQVVAVVEGCELALDKGDEQDADTQSGEARGATVAKGALTVASLLVGDICDYTVLVRHAPPAEVQQSVNRVFEVLSAAVERLGGTVKEFQGDALVAFWEGGAHGDRAAAMACHAALELDRVAQRLAADAAVWQIADFPLRMDWAIATGPVMIDTFGDQRAGLSMIGPPIVLAFRLEKFADAATGRILTCPATREMAGSRFEFRDLGEMLAKGFSKADRVFALQRETSAGHPARTA